MEKQQQREKKQKKHENKIIVRMGEKIRRRRNNKFVRWTTFKDKKQKIFFPLFCLPIIAIIDIQHSEFNIAKATDHFAW